MNKASFIEEQDVRAIELETESESLSLSTDPDGCLFFTHIDASGKQTDFSMPDGILCEKALEWIGLRRCDSLKK